MKSPILSLLVPLIVSAFFSFETKAQTIALPSSIDVSSIGAATYSIPIDVVPGTAGMQPNLAICYNSMGGNGNIGYRWSLVGASAITLVGQSLHYDENITPVNGDISDRYMLDGNRMVCINNDNYHSIDAIYTFEQDDHSRIGKASNGGFIDTMFDSRIAEYGRTSNSRFIVNGTTYAWMINRVTDGNNNYMTYEYENVNNEMFLTRIDYTGNTSASLTPYASVRFTYANTNTSNDQYLNGLLLHQHQILRYINIYYLDSLVREYRLSYSSTDGKEYLSNISMYDGNGRLLSRTSIEWNHFSGDISSDINFPITGAGYRIVAGNFDNDRLHDFFVVNESSGNSSQPATCLVKRSYNGMHVTSTLQCQFASDADFSTMKAVDIDGDGMDEILYQTIGDTHDVYTMKLSNALNAVCTSQLLLSDVVWGQPVFGDFDGDGLVEIVALSCFNQMKCYGIDGIPDNSSYALSGNYLQGRVGDFDGDGKSDIMLLRLDYAFIFTYDIVSHQWLESEGISLFGQTDTPMVGDFNGDGQSDILFKKNGQLWQVAIRKGKNQWGIATLNELDTLSDASSHQPQYIPAVTDADGDGKSDILQQSSETSIKFIKLKGYSNNQLHYDLLSIDKSSLQNFDAEHMDFGDFDCNGTVDIVFFDPQQGGASASIKYLYPNNHSNGLVNKITDALGKEYVLKYSPISLMPYKHSVTGTHWIQMPLVKDLFVSNGLGGYDTTSYYYGAVSFAGTPRRFIGFQFFAARSNQRMVVQHFVMLPKGESTSEHFDILVPDTVKTYAVSSLSATSQNPFNDLYTPWHRQDDKIMSIQAHIYKSMYKSVTNGFTIFMPYRYRLYEIDLLRNMRRLTTTNMHASLWLPQSQYITDYNQTGNSQWAYRETYGMSYSPTTFPNGVRKYQVTSKRCNISYNNNTTNVMRDTIYSTYSQGRLTRTLVKSNSGTSDTTRYSYNACGLVTKKTERPKGTTARFTTFTYDETMRFVTSKSNNIGHTSQCAYDAATGQPKRETDIRGLATRHIYDDEGRTIQQNNPDGTHDYYEFHRYAGSSIANAVTRSIASPHARPSVTYYNDCLGRTILTHTAGQGYQDVEYDRKGRKVRETLIPYDTLNAVIKQCRNFTYDIYGRTTSETSHYVNNTYTYHPETYTSNDHLYYEQVNRNDNTFTKTYYDAAGRTVQVEDRGGTINYKYNIIKKSGKYYYETLIIYNNDTTRIVADNRGRRISIKDPNAGLTTTTYNGWGEVLTQTDANGNVVTFTYDAIGRVASRKTKAPSASATTYQYVYYDDNVDTSARCGQLWKVVEGSTVRHRFIYDNCGRVSSELRRILTTNYTHKYTYNSDGQLFTMRYPDGFTVRYIYNIYGEPESVQDVSTGEVIFFVDRRDKMRHITRAWYGNNTGVKYAYNEYGLPVLQQYGWRIPATPLRDTIGGGGGIIAPYNPSEHYDVSDFFAVNSYEYKTNGYLKLRREEKSGQHEHYYYDNFGRLNLYNVTSNGGSAPYTFSYSPNGNMLSNGKIHTGESYSYELAKPNAVSAINANNGRISPTQCAVTYNAFNRPSQIEEGSDRLMLYYNYDGHLTHTRLLQNGTAVCTTYYVFKDYEKERFSSFSRYYGFVYFEGRPVAVRMRHDEAAYTRDTMFYIQTDLLGSWERVLDEAGHVVQANHFDPWGNRMMASNWRLADTAVSHLFRRGFTGHEHYDRFRIINTGARLYDPVIARFFSPDPQVQFPYSTQSYNRYTYCNNNPVMYVDPDGESILLAMLIGAVVGGAINLGIHFSQGDVENFGQGLMYFGTGAVGGALSVAIGGYGPQLLTGVGQMTGMSWLAGAGETLNAIWDIGHTIDAVTTVAGMVTHPQNAFKILLGQFYFDEQGWHGLSQAITRYTGELPQTWLGYNVSQARNAAGWVDRVDYLGGVTFATKEEWAGGRYEGVSLGPFSNVWTNQKIEGDFEQYIKFNDPYQVFMHEYGHNFDSQMWGWLYLTVVGFNSAYWAIKDPSIQHGILVERWANRHAARYFNDTDWNDKNNPR